jgi:hypothetical protein
MSLRNTVFAGLIVGLTLDRTEFPLASHAALKLIAHFAGGALFERVGATARHESASKKSQRQGLHLLILESAPGNASVVGALVSSAETK